MLQYLLSSQFRQSHKFLSQANLTHTMTDLTSSNLSHLGIKIRYQLKQQNNIQFFRRCFEVLQQYNNKPRQMVRVIIFAHVVLQSTSKRSKQLINIISEQLNIMVQNSRKFRTSKKDSKPALPQPAQEINLSHEEQPVNNKNLNNHKFNLQRKRSRSENVQNIQKSPNTSKQINMQDRQTMDGTSTKKSQQLSEQQIICQKLIQPYCLYLLKKCKWQAESQDQFMNTQKQVLIWHQINLLKQLFQITESYYLILRYYNKKYMKIIIKLTQLLNHDIHGMYGRLVRQVKNGMHDCIKYYATIESQQKHNINNKDNIDIQQQQKTQKKLTELNQLLTEISSFNDQIINTYLSKYLVQQLRKRNITKPQLMNLQSIQCQYLYAKIDDLQKKQGKRLKKLDIGKKSMSEVNGIANNFKKNASFMNNVEQNANSSNIINGKLSTGIQQIPANTFMYLKAINREISSKLPELRPFNSVNAQTQDKKILEQEN